MRKQVFLETLLCASAVLGKGVERDTWVNKRGKAPSSWSFSSGETDKGGR